MLTRLFVCAFGVLFLSGCATAGKKHALELQQCQNRIAYLEEELSEKEREVAQLERGRRRGGEGSSVISSDVSTTQIQKALKNAGYYKGAIDGKIGAKTREAITKFQKDNGLKADGKVGRMTWSELKPYLD